MSGVGKYISHFSRGKTHYWKKFLNSVLINLHFIHPFIWIGWNNRCNAQKTIYN